MLHKGSWHRIELNYTCVMLVAALSLMTAVPAVPTAISLLRITKDECPAPSFDKNLGNLGDRAIIADDGGKMVVQCGDGSIRFWQGAGGSELKRIERMPLFKAAQRYGVVKADLPCPSSSLLDRDFTIYADCEVIDHTDDGSVYVLRNNIDLTSFVVSERGAAHELTTWQRPGGVRKGKRARIEIFVVDGQKRPEALQILSEDGGIRSSVAQLQSPNLILEEGEGSAEEVAYSNANDLVVISFGGSFRVAEDMTYVRALTAEGKEKWTIRGKLPPRNDSLIVGDYTKLVTFSDGKYAAFGKISNRRRAEIIRLNDGSVVGTLSGWPLASARGQRLVLIKEEEGDLVLVDTGNLP